MQACSSFRSNHSETTVVYGNNHLLTTGIQELENENFNRIVIVPTRNALDGKEIRQFLGPLEKKIVFVYYHVCNSLQPTLRAIRILPLTHHPVCSFFCIALRWTVEPRRPGVSCTGAGQED